MGETSWKEEGGLHTDTDLRRIDKTSKYKYYTGTTTLLISFCFKLLTAVCYINLILDLVSAGTNILHHCLIFKLAGPRATGSCISVFLSANGDENSERVQVGQL